MFVYHLIILAMVDITEANSADKVRSRLAEDPVHTTYNLFLVSNSVFFNF